MDRDALAGPVSNRDADAGANAYADAYADAVAHVPDADPYLASDADYYGDDAAVGDANACLQSNPGAHGGF